MGRNLITNIHINFGIVAFEDSKEANFVFEVVLKTNHAVMEVFKMFLKNSRATHISVTLTLFINACKEKYGRLSVYKPSEISTTNSPVILDLVYRSVGPIYLIRTRQH